MKKQQLTRVMIRGLVLGGLLFAQASTVLADRATVVSDAIWVHDELYGTVATDTSFKSPPAHSTDIIYSFANSGLAGQRSIAEYAPGDKEFNGGRWNVMFVKYTDAGLAVFDMDAPYGEAEWEITNAEDLEMYKDMGLLTVEPAGIFFECPLRPQRGRR